LISRFNSCVQCRSSTISLFLYPLLSIATSMIYTLSLHDALPISSLSSSFSRLLIFRGQQFFQRSKPSAAESRWQHRQEVLRSRPGIEVAIQHRLHFTVRRLPTEAGKEPTNYNESETLRPSPGSPPRGRSAKISDHFTVPKP